MRGGGGRGKLASWRSVASICRRRRRSPLLTPLAEPALAVLPPLCTDYTTACLAWLESKGMASLGGLASQLVVPHHNLTALTVDRVYPQKRRPRRTLRSPLPPPPKKSPTKRAG